MTCGVVVVEAEEAATSDGLQVWWSSHYRGWGLGVKSNDVGEGVVEEGQVWWQYL